jgi:hypothetical protein
MKNKNAIIRPANNNANGHGICGPNGLNVINFVMELNFVDNYVSVEIMQIAMKVMMTVYVLEFLKLKLDLATF